MQVAVDGSVSQMDLDSGFFKDWNLVQIEGEEPVALDEDEEGKKDAKGKPAAADKKKAAPGKAGAGGGKQTFEEIADNRPRIVNYTHDFAENGIAPMKVTEAVGEKFATQFLKLMVVSTNRENGEETVEETIEIDISCLLYPREDVQFSWTFDKLKIMSVHELTVKVESDLPLLSEYLGKKLNPMQINLVAIKDIPFKTEPRFKPIFATLKFVDGQTFTTREMPQQADCRF